MKKHVKILGLVLVLTVTAGCLTALADDNAAQDSKSEMPAKTYTITDEAAGGTITFEVPEMDAITVEELSDQTSYMIVCDEAGWQLELRSDAMNSEALEKMINDGEALTYGDNTGYLEFSSWAAGGAFNLCQLPDRPVSLIAKYDLRPSDTYQPDDEAELRGYLEDDYVKMILASLKGEPLSE